MGWLGSWPWFIALVLILVFLPLLFPNEQLVSQRWRPVAWAAQPGSGPPLTEEAHSISAPTYPRVNSWVCGLRWSSRTAPAVSFPLKRKMFSPSVMLDS